MIGLLAVAWFPLFPWLAFPVAGVVLGRRLIADRPGLAWRWARMGVVALTSGLAVAVTSTLGGRGNPVTDHLSVLSFTPESTSLLLVQLGIVLLTMAVAHAALDRSSPAGRWMDPIRLVSRYALTVYVASYLVIFGCIHVADLLDPSREHMYGMTDSVWALLFGLGFVVVTVPVLTVWDRHGGKWSLEWTMAHLKLRAGSRSAGSRSAGLRSRT